MSEQPTQGPPPQTALAEVPKKSLGGTVVALERLALHAYQSGLFKGKVPNVSAGVIALAFGNDLGLSPTTSLTSIHVIEGKPVMSGNLMLALVKKTPGWKVKVIERSNTRCVLEWVENGEVQGRSEFSMEDAKLAGLQNKDNWRKYPKAMLFNRAVSDGFKTYCPHLACGHTVYTPEELGADVDADGEIVCTLSISEAQALEVRALLDETQSDEKKFLSYYQISKIDELTPEQHESAVRMLRTKLTAIKTSRKEEAARASS